MANKSDRDEIVAKGKEDGIRLFKISEFIYKILIIFNWILAIGGISASIGMVSSGIAAGGLVIFLATAVLCTAFYAGAVLSTHFAKVLVHLLFANLALLEKE